MACEVLACAVRSMLATLTDRRAHHMRTLFAAVAPQLVADAARDAPTWLGSLPPDHAAALRSLAADMAAAGGFDASALPLRAEVLRPYLAGYWSKVVGVLCRVRPADTVRFLLRTPGVGHALVAHAYNGSVAGTLAAVLSLPLPVFPATKRGGGKQDGEGDEEGWAGMRLCPRDPRSLPDLLLDCLQGALQACLRACGLDGEEEAAAGARGGPSPSPCGPTPAQADACAAVAEVLCGSLVRARCSCPHPKFAAEGYNASRLRGIGGSAGSASGGGGSGSGVGGGSSDAGGPSSHGYSFSGGAGHYEGEEEGGGSGSGAGSTQQPGGAAGGAAGSSQAQGWGGAPAAFDADAAAASAALEAAALSRLNTQVAPDYHSPAPQPADNTHLHLMRWLRDGQGAGRLAGAVAAAAEVLAAFPGPAAPPSHRARGSTSSRTADSPSSLLPPPVGADGGVGGISQANGPVSAVCEAVLTLAAGVAEAAAVSWLQQMAFSADATDALAAAPAAAAAAAAGAGEASVGPCPRFLLELLPLLPQLVGLLQDLNATGTQANAGALQGQQGTAAAAAGPSAGGEAAAPFAPFPSSKPAPRLGPAGLALVRCLCALVRCGWPQVVAAAAGLRLHARLLDSVAAFAWHSVLHRAVTDALLACLHDGSAAMRRAALFDAALLSRVVSCGKLGGMPASLQEAFAPGANYPRAGPAAAGPAAGADAALRPPSQAAGAGDAGVSGGPSVCPRVVRVGYTGHLCQLGNAVVSAYARGALLGSHGGAEAADAAELSGGSSGSLAALVKSHGDWWRFVDRELACANVQRGVLLGGLPPDTAKSGNVGTAGDAQARPAAVDEVAALEAKEGAGGAGDRLSDDGSGSDDEEEEEAAERRRRHAEEERERERGGEEASLVGGPSRRAARPPSPPSPRSSEGEGEGQEEGASDGGEQEEEGSAGQQPQPPLYGALDEDEEGEGEGAGTAAEGDDGFAAAAFESSEWGQAQPAQGQGVAVAPGGAGSSADSGAAWDFGSSHPSGAGTAGEPAAAEEDWGFGSAAAPAPAPSDASSSPAPAPAAASFDDFGFAFDEGGAASGSSAGTTAQSGTAAVASTDEFGFDAGSALDAASRQKASAQPTADDFSWG